MNFKKIYNEIMKKLIAISILISALTCACTNTGTIIKPNAEQQVQEEVRNIHPIDKAIQDCMSKQDATHEMNKCVYIAMDSWSKEIDKYLNLLKSATTEEDYNNILKAQKDWETYKDSEFEAVSVIMEKQGTMFLNSTVGMKSALIKERALFLKEFYDTLSYKN